MNQKQAKRIRRAAYAFIAREQTSLEPGPSARDAAATFGVQLRMMWPFLNHRQRGAVSADLKGRQTIQWRARAGLGPVSHVRPYNLVRAVRTAIRAVTS